MPASNDEIDDDSYFYDSDDRSSPSTARDCLNCGMCESCIDRSISAAEDSAYKCYLYPDGVSQTPTYVSAASPEDAAETFHDLYNTAAAGLVYEITVAVIDPDGNETRWNVSAEPTVLYYASPVEII